MCMCNILQAMQRFQTTCNEAVEQPWNLADGKPISTALSLTTQKETDFFIKSLGINQYALDAHRKVFLECQNKLKSVSIYQKVLQQKNKMKRTKKKKKKKNSDGKEERMSWAGAKSIVAMRAAMGGGDNDSDEEYDDAPTGPPPPLSLHIKYCMK